MQVTTEVTQENEEAEQEPEPEQEDENDENQENEGKGWFLTKYVLLKSAQIAELKLELN